MFFRSLGNCFGPDGIDEIRQILENAPFAADMIYDDDEGSGGEDDHGEGEEEYDEEDNDEDYEDYDEDEDEDDEDEDDDSPSYIFGNNQQQQQQIWPGFQFNPPKTPSSQPESATDLSSMIAGFNVCSPFSFSNKTTPMSDETHSTTKVFRFIHRVELV